jgi:hypothetical protein
VARGGPLSDWRALRRISSPRYDCRRPVMQ